MSVIVRQTGIAELGDPALMAQAEYDVLQEAVTILEPLARGEAPRRTGRGASGIRGVIDRTRSGAPVARIGPTRKAFYLRILAVGAVPHEIAPFRFRAKARAARAARALGPGRARGALRALRFFAGGQTLFRRLVQHPGLRPDPFLERAARAGEGAVIVAADRAVQARLRSAG